jgi:ketosteroid isomerase-like protein
VLARLTGAWLVLVVVQIHGGKIMRKVIGIALATSALVLLSACKMDGQERQGHADSAAIEKQIRDIEAQWKNEYNAHDVDALVAHYADNAALANPGAPLATDAAARRAALAQVVADPNLKHDFAADRVLVAKSGELAASRGHYTMQTTDPATKQPKIETGTYMTVYSKQADGSWKAIEDAVIPGAPSTKSAAAAN